MGRWLISVGDAVSQLAGRLIWVRVGGQWQCWTANANESVSGAAYRWAISGHFGWVRRVIDVLLRPLGRDHCRESFLADYHRASEYVATANDMGVA